MRRTRHEAAALRQDVNDHRRGETEHAHLMREVAEPLNEQGMRDVGAYYASLKPSPAAESSD